ncbi:MAG: hypothetical protein OHK0039_23570 [Bacteroidia bacterium]
MAVLLLSVRCAHAQRPQTTFVPLEPETFANAYVWGFYKDSKGYMWIGTSDGLVRYDGINLYRYEHRPGDSHSIRHNNINAMVEDAHGQLWVGTSLGLCVYDRGKDHFTDIDSIPGSSNYLNSHYITALAFDHDGLLWIGTLGGGVNVYDPTARRFTYIADSTVGTAVVSTNYVNCLMPVDDLMWCGTKGGLKVFSITEKAPARLKPLDGQGPSGQITQLLSDKAGNIWLSTMGGEIMQLMLGNGYYVAVGVLSGVATYGAGWNNTLSLCQDPLGNLWIGGKNAGLNYFDTRTGKVTRFLADEDAPDKLPTNSIRAVYVDDQGLTWIGTYSRGPTSSTITRRSLAATGACVRRKVPKGWMSGVLPKTTVAISGSPSIALGCAASTRRPTPSRSRTVSTSN